ncbi:MAG TPA: type II toxin-antitoxin system PemK/MazF family toxin [Acetobacteraceae bacterium]|jgi:mRNA interferase MazF|nr:type II toxin-antitoxin system PemK/MazF family toxin [Acetobacteraceae bacterium]
MPGADPLARGDIVTVAGGASEFGSKPRPAIILQATLLGTAVPIPICPITSTVRPDTGLLRIALPVDANTGLALPSWAAIDLVQTVRQRRIGERIGHAGEAAMLAIDRSLMVFLGLA